MPRVSLPGWDPSRTDADPKQLWGSYVQDWLASGKPYDADAVRSIVAAHPEWEIDPTSSVHDPRIRVKQAALDTWKPGTSTWQDVIRDSGPGGANAPQFLNAPGPSEVTGPPMMRGGAPRTGAPSSWWEANAPPGAVTAPVEATQTPPSLAAVYRVWGFVPPGSSANARYRLT